MAADFGLAPLRRFSEQELLLMPTRITAAKLDHAVKALRGVLECQDSAQYLESGAVEEAIRALLQARVQLWNGPRAR